ncbi:3703_t:CDS:2 [Acaulospora colombiana]|uniref:3703_t:CDS:1 n=1 Tax=Acaulospora colombiana TaxID=27376 RepID=A0ACA9LFN4_9GLOM|nr:3703_t:CDS:2 [Acaulospora colombiana]
MAAESASSRQSSDSKQDGDVPSFKDAAKLDPEEEEISGDT